MPNDSDTPIDTVSRVAYGKTRRLELMMAALKVPGDRLCQKDLIDATSASPDTVKQMFVELAQLGMLEPIPAEPGLRNKYFRRIEGLGWSWARELAGKAAPGAQSETLW